MSLSPPFRDLTPELADQSLREFDIFPPQVELSTAQLNLQRLYEQATRASSKKDGAKVSDPSAVPPKGKPRLLLMGQRR